jgi:hypothetical protein
MNARQAAALAEVEHAAVSLRHDLLLMALSIDVILAECRDAQGGGSPDPHPDEGEAVLIVVTRGEGL